MLNLYIYTMYGDSEQSYMFPMRNALVKGLSIQRGSPNSARATKKKAAAVFETNVNINLF